MIQLTAIPLCQFKSLPIDSPLTSANKLQEKQAHLVTLLASDSPDVKELEKTLEGIGDLENSLLGIRVKHDIEIRKRLTPNQQILFDSWPKPKGNSYREVWYFALNPLPVDVRCTGQYDQVWLVCRDHFQVLTGVAFLTNSDNDHPSLGGSVKKKVAPCPG